MALGPFGSLIARARRHRWAVFFDECYRLPLAGVDSPSGMDVRRAEDALTWLFECRAATRRLVRRASPVTWEALARVHHHDYLESLSRPQTLADIFAVHPSDVVVDPLLRALRVACGGTLEGARLALKARHPVLNLLGGFHHAAPGRGAGFCALNDVVVAVRALQAEGFAGKVAVIDLDAHPGDGTAECLGKDPRVHLAGLSGSNWGPLEGVDEVLLPPGTDDASYLAALDHLLARLPEADLAFVLAGGDVLTGDRLGTLRVSLVGVRERDLRVLRRLGDVPSVWLPAGGYGPHAWKALAGTGMALAFHTDEPIPTDFEPLGARFRHTFFTLAPEELGGSTLLTEDDVAEALGQPRAAQRRFLGFYTPQGLEHGLERYGVLAVLRRLGFEQLHVELETVGRGDRARLRGLDPATGQAVSLVELECDRRTIGPGTFLFVNWLTLRNPRAHFSQARPQLPGQEVPGLGLSREMTQLLGLIAKRLVLDGVAFRPSWYHMAYAARHGARFVDAARQGRFEALVRDLRTLSLLEATHAVADGRVRLNGQPYAWEPDEMVTWLDPAHAEGDLQDVARERERCHFEVAPRTA